MITTDYTVTTSFDVIEDDIEIVSLVSNSPDWWENVTIVTLVIMPVHSPVSYTFSMGDGNDCGLSNDVVTGTGCDVQSTVSSDSVTTVLRFTYSTWGDYTITVSLSNGITQYHVSTTIDISVLEWTCSPPTISLPDDVTSPSFRSILKSEEDSFTVTVDSLDCMKSQEVAYAWSIYDNTDTSMTAAEALVDGTASELFLPDRLPLIYGEYYAQVTVSMVIDEVRFGAGPPVQAQADAHFQYYPSPTVTVLADNGKNRLQ